MTESPPRGSMRIEPMPDDEVDGVLEALAKTIPTLSLSREGAIGVRLGPRAFLFLPNRNATADLPSLARRAAQLGVVAAPREREGSGWEARLHVLTDPGGGDRFTISVISASGRTRFTGEGTVRPDGIDFDVTSVDRRGGATVRVRGGYDGRGVSIDKADVELRARESAPAPRTRGAAG